jgi:hypothetical protein
MRGDLSEMPATDVCRALATSGTAGVLEIEGPDGRGAIVFRDGRVIAATSPTPRARLGDRLVNAGLLDEDALDEVLRSQARADTHRRLGGLLVDQGLVSHDAVRLVAQEQVIDAVFDVVRWRYGGYRFDPGDLTDGADDVPIDIPVDQLLVEVARREQEWAELERVIPDLEAIPTFVSGTGSAVASLEPDEFTVLASIDGVRSVRDLADDLGYGQFEAARIVYGLTMLGIVEVTLPEDEVGRALDEALHALADGQRPDAGAGEVEPAVAAAEPEVDEHEPVAAAEPEVDEHEPVAAAGPTVEAVDEPAADAPDEVEPTADEVEEPTPWESSPAPAPATHHVIEVEVPSDATPAVDPTAPDDGTVPAPDDGTDQAAGDGPAPEGEPAPDADESPSVVEVARLLADLGTGSPASDAVQAETPQDPPGAEDAGPTATPQEPATSPAPARSGWVDPPDHRGTSATSRGEPDAEGPAPAEPTTSERGDEVSELLRELSRLALEKDAEQGEPPEPRRDTPPPPPEPRRSSPGRDDPPRRRRLFGRG